jgi:hypothetical protein
MKHNVGRLDQFIRIFIGLSLLAYIVKDGTLMPGWPLVGIIGALLVGTGFLSYCPLYDWLRISTRNSQDHLT